MNEIEEWFNEEFGHLGFSLTPVIYDPTDFSPRKGVLYNGLMTHLKVTPQLATDVQSSFGSLADEYREMLKQGIYLFLLKKEFDYDYDGTEPMDFEVEYLYRKDRKLDPKKKLPKFKFKNY